MTRRNPRTRSSSLGTAYPGILGVQPTEPEIVGVYPKLSASYHPHRQEIRFFRGDSFDLPVQIQDDNDPADPVSIDGAVLRWAAKQNPHSESIPPTDLTVFIRKSTYEESEVELTEAVGGRAVIHIRREDTVDLPIVPAWWDLEVTSPREEIPLAPGTAVTTTTSPVVTVYGFDLTSVDLRRGDILVVGGRRVLVREVLSPSMVETEYDGWESEGGLSLTAFRATTRTVASGPFRVMTDIA